MGSLVEQLKKVLIKPTTYDFKAHFGSTLTESLILKRIFTKVNGTDGVTTFDIHDNNVIFECNDSIFEIKIENDSYILLKNDTKVYEGIKNIDTLKEIYKNI